jgi:hypothetical protein
MTIISAPIAGAYPPCLSTLARLDRASAAGHGAFASSMGRMRLMLFAAGPGSGADGVCALRLIYRVRCHVILNGRTPAGIGAVAFIEDVSIQVSDLDPGIYADVGALIARQVPKPEIPS